MITKSLATATTRHALGVQQLKAFCSERVVNAWIRFWMRQAGLTRWGRFATWMATHGAPPFYGTTALSTMNPLGYIAPSATVCHPDVRFGRHLFLGDRVVLYRCRDGGPITLHDGVRLHVDTILQTEQGGSIVVGADTHIHPRCILSACKGSIRIGAGVQIAANCAFYPYDHGTEPGVPITAQPITTRGDIVVGDGAWLGTGVIVLSGVHVGKGAVVAAGAVVTRDVPDYGVVAGVPARLLRLRTELPAAALSAGLDLVAPRSPT